MKLKSARIKHFKRFVDLTIRNLPTDAKLVVLLGPNGCGKSSLFDAFQRSLKVDQFYGMSNELRRYYQRATSEGIAESDDVSLEFHGGNPTSEVDLRKSLYIRSAYRHEPSFQNTTFQQVGNVLDRHAVRRLIDTDQTVQDNYQRIIWRVMRKMTTPGLTTDGISKDTIGDLQKSMRSIFGDLRLDALVSAEETGTFTFTKKKSRNFLYENLSAGEKAAFDPCLSGYHPHPTICSVSNAFAVPAVAIKPVRQPVEVQAMPAMISIVRNQTELLDGFDDVHVLCVGRAIVGQAEFGKWPPIQGMISKSGRRHHVGDLTSLNEGPTCVF